MPRNQCPPSRRGHTWQALTIVPPSQSGASIYELRACGRCGAIGRINKQGVICVVETA